MDLQTRPDLFELLNFKGRWVVTSQHGSSPTVLLSVSGIGGPRKALIEELYSSGGGIEYAGSYGANMFFRDVKPTKNKDTEKTVFKIYCFEAKIDGTAQEIRDSPSKSIFLNQQPYFIQKTGLVNHVYHLHPFDDFGSPPVEIDIAGVSLNNCLKVFHKGYLIVFRNDTASKVERVSKNCIVVIYPGLNENCNTFTEDDLDCVYISDGNRALYMFNTAELQLWEITFNFSFHIRCVRNGIAILASETGLIYHTLEDKCWKSRTFCLNELKQLQTRNEQLEQSLKRLKLDSAATIARLENEIAKAKSITVRKKKQLIDQMSHLQAERIATTKKLEEEQETLKSFQMFNEECTARIDERDKQIVALKRELRSARAAVAEKLGQDITKMPLNEETAKHKQLEKNSLGEIQLLLDQAMLVFLNKKLREQRLFCNWSSFEPREVQ
ncbi:hypothetical protein PENTCL1PPCAC_13423 [Pristionchus entomophagus]|uniref:Uncharacterized protein n=1 Tax=Pristionchus entomophagus TaxID=358040 RepID=A0AAV5T7P4_9BILA|nr:hypothetical protein PENTCL1PPCAC_13423 [Pristionchus entomophagus]